LEIVPKEIQNHSACKKVDLRFGTSPSRQILDENLHHEAMKALKNREKRGRPDVVHFALLDIISTPLYQLGKIDVIIHTINDESIFLKSAVRLPRTLDRFKGVMSKILTSELGETERKLFKFNKSETFGELINDICPEYVIGFSRSAASKPLSEVAHEKGASGKIAWVIGGFPFGSFEQDALGYISSLYSVSDLSLAAHVVTARLCYELEKSVGIRP
jgi:rRNA small subunit pseudouridine methyltransferase Nep1